MTMKIIGLLIFWFLILTGTSVIKWLDPRTPQIKVLADGQIDAPGLGIINQDGDSYFENFFALRPDKNGFDAASSMKFSMEHQNPLVAGRIKGESGYNDQSFSLFVISNTHILVWSMKPVEEGIGH